LYIKEVVSNYLNNSEVDYALLINGRWGSGKTYYWFNVLEPMIEATEYGEDFFKPIYVSLNGISSKEEIFSQLIGRYLNAGKGKKLSFNILKTAIAGAGSKLVGDSAFDDFSDKITENIHEHFLDKLSNVVLCIDDLERVSDKVSITEILGILNTYFIEHNNIKTIIIADESKITEEKYAPVKEKYIRNTLIFNYQTIEVIDALLITGQYENETLVNFIRENEDILINLYEKAGRNNIRTLKHIFDILNTIVKELDQSERTNLGPKIVQFVLSIMFEFKEGNIHSTDIPNPFWLDDIDGYLLKKTFEERSQKQLGEKKDKTFTDKFYEKYIDGTRIDFTYFDSIYQYILTGYFDNKTFREEVIKLSDNSQETNYDVYYRLKNFTDLSDEEYLDKIKIFLNKIESGSYYFYDYLEIYDFTKYLLDNNLIDISLDQMNDLFDEGIDKAAKDCKYNCDKYGTIKSTYNDITDQNFKNLFKKIKSRHELIRNDYYQQKFNEYFKANYEKKENEFKTNQIIRVEPIFDHYDAKTFCDKIIDSENFVIENIKKILSTQIREGTLILDGFIKEQLIKEFSDYASKLINKPIRRFLIEEIIKIISGTIQKA